ncbi:MAG: hypothetical protein V2I43_01630 [Parvularcula sp.]|jgi:hypothetical protein|nr:hypothetical protein [Parvularcula sp.]
MVQIIRGAPKNTGPFISDPRDLLRVKGARGQFYGIHTTTTTSGGTHDAAPAGDATQWVTIADITAARGELFGVFTPSMPNGASFVGAEFRLSIDGLSPITIPLAPYANSEGTIGPCAALIAGFPYFLSTSENYEYTFVTTDRDYEFECSSAQLRIDARELFATARQGRSLRYNSALKIEGRFLAQPSGLSDTTFARDFQAAISEVAL